MPLRDVPEHPGVVLARVLEKLRMSQAELARRVNLSSKHINQLCKGHSNIVPLTAVKLEEATTVDAEQWMLLQVRHDIAVARGNLRDRGGILKVDTEAARAIMAEALG